MSRFKVGDYIVNKSDVKFNIIHIHNQDDLDFINSYGRYKNYRLVINLDYIHTLNAEQMTWFIEVKYPEIAKNGVPEIWLQKPYDGWEVGWMKTISAYEMLEWLIKFHTNQYCRPDWLEPECKEPYYFVPQAVAEAEERLFSKLINIKAVFDE